MKYIKYSIVLVLVIVLGKMLLRILQIHGEMKI